MLQNAMEIWSIVLEVFHGLENLELILREDAQKYVEQRGLLERYR